MIGGRSRLPVLLSLEATTARRLALLAGAGALSLAAYAALLFLPLRLDAHEPSRSFNLAVSLGEDTDGLARFAATVVLLFALYLCGLWTGRRAGRYAALLALGFAAAFGLVMLPAHPFYSLDVFHYIATSREWFVHGRNPLITAPQALPGDPLSHLSDWGTLPSPYGPVWTFLTALPQLVVRGSDSAALNLVAFKALSLACGLVAAWLAGVIAERLRPGTRAAGVVMLGWNPLFVLHVAGDGHNDIAMLCLLMAGFYLALGGRVLLAGCMLALSALVKFASLLCLPLFVLWLWRLQRPHPRRDAMLAAGMLPLLAVLTYLPFWDGWRTLDASRDEGGYLTTSIPAALLPLLETVMSRHVAETLLVVGPRLAFAPVLLLVAVRTRSREGLIAAGALTFLLYLVLATPWFMPWYALWPVTLAAAVPWRRMCAPVLALTFGALLLPSATSFLRAMTGEYDRWRPLNQVGALIVFTPVCVAFASMLVAWKRDIREAAAAPCAPARQNGPRQGEPEADECGKVEAIAGQGRASNDHHAGQADRPGSAGALHRAGAGADQGLHGEPG